MKTRTVLEVTIDCISLEETSRWSSLWKKIDKYNAQTGKRKGLTHIQFEIDITKASPVPKEIQHLVDGMTRGAIGIKPYEEIEGQCAVETISIKDTNIVIKMNGIGEAEENSKFIDPDDDLVYRGFKSETSCEYEDYRLGQMVGHGYFC